MAVEVKGCTFDQDLLWKLYSSRLGPPHYYWKRKEISLVSEKPAVYFVRDYSEFHQERIIQHCHSLLHFHKVIRAKHKLQQVDRDGKPLHSLQCWNTLLQMMSKTDQQLQTWQTVWMKQFPFRQPSQIPEEYHPPLFSCTQPAWEWIWLWKQKEFQECSLFCWIHLLRSFVHTLLEDDLFAMKDSCFEHELFVVLRQLIQHYTESLHSWQKEFDPSHHHVHYLLLRCLRPFSHFLPCIQFFFRRTVEKGLWIRLFLYHHRQSIDMLQFFSINLAQDEYPLFSETMLRLSLTQQQAYQQFVAQLSSCGVQGVGNQEAEIDIDEICPIRYRLDMLDSGGKYGKQRLTAKSFVMIHVFQRIQCMELFLQHFPLNDLFRPHFLHYLQQQRDLYHELYQCQLISEKSSSSTSHHNNHPRQKHT